MSCLGDYLGKTLDVTIFHVRMHVMLYFSQGARAPIYGYMFFPLDKKAVSSFIIKLLSTICSISITNFVNKFASQVYGHQIFYSKAKSNVTRFVYEISTLQLIACGVLKCSCGTDENDISITNLLLAYNTENLLPMCSFNTTWKYIKTY